MNFTLTVSEEDLNTIITALRFEQKRATEAGNSKDLAYINHAIDTIDNNTYVANVKEVK